ncbi:restriction endonuclease subunit S [Candidatus Avelusimicrobium fimicolum]|uniref:restriction endonuclease subunit S n=1 Tax=Candidatus Avelusimicrobium fimicolum TaxID=3416216 RepID=UPI003D14442A
MESVRIADICSQVYSGGTPTSTNSSYYDGDIPWLNTNEVNFCNIYKTNRTISEEGLKHSAAKFVPVNTIIVAMYGVTAGRSAIAKIPLTTNQACCNLVIDSKKANYQYVYYFLKQQAAHLNSLANGGAQQNLNSLLIKKYSISLPSLKEQDKIASILSVYDDLIEKNNRKIAILQEMAEELYKEWFVRFRFPGYKTARFKDGIPEGWKYRTFGEIVTCERGISYSSEEIDCEDGVNLINLKNINAYGGFRLDGTKKYNGKYKNNQVVQCGDLVMGVTDMTQDRRTVGAVALIPPFDNTCVISADLIKVVSHIDNIFIYCLCKYGYYSKFFSQFANGSNVLHLKPSSLRNQKVLIPTEELINKFVKIVKPINDTINNLNRQNDTLTQQRDLLLPRLMSGKLEVRA